MAAAQSRTGRGRRRAAAVRGPRAAGRPRPGSRVAERTAHGGDRRSHLPIVQAQPFHRREHLLLARRGSAFGARIGRRRGAVGLRAPGAPAARTAPPRRRAAALRPARPSRSPRRDRAAPRAGGPRSSARRSPSVAKYSPPGGIAQHLGEHVALRILDAAGDAHLAVAVQQRRPCPSRAGTAAPDRHRRSIVDRARRLGARAGCCAFPLRAAEDLRHVFRRRRRRQIGEWRPRPPIAPPFARRCARARRAASHASRRAFPHPAPPSLRRTVVERRQPRRASPRRRCSRRGAVR